MIHFYSIRLQARPSPRTARALTCRDVSHLVLATTCSSSRAHDSTLLASSSPTLAARGRSRFHKSEPSILSHHLPNLLLSLFDPFSSPDPNSTPRFRPPDSSTSQSDRYDHCSACLGQLKTTTDLLLMIVFAVYPAAAADTEANRLLLPPRMHAAGPR